LYGGAAGCGKTLGLILEPLRYVRRVINFTAVFFQRTTPQITNPGGLWDESPNFYPRLSGTPHLGAREWRWRRGGKIKFAHLQFDNTVYDWQGAQITLIGSDELTHFTAHQFFYMVSRNRSTCGVRPYTRATCNPRGQLGRRFPGVVDRPGVWAADPRAGRCPVLFYPRCGQHRVGRSPRRVDATPAAAASKFRKRACSFESFAILVLDPVVTGIRSTRNPCSSASPARSETQRVSFISTSLGAKRLSAPSGSNRRS
jgi:hypothetical protein